MKSIGVRLLSCAVGLAAFTGCSERPLPTAIMVAELAAPAVATDPGPAANEYELISYAADTRTLTAFSKLANVCDNLTPVDPCRFRLTVALASDSWLQPANLDGFSPTDPCRDLAENYNIVAVDEPPDAEIAAMAALGCNARILVDMRSATIRQFRPVP
jgi:hypothetical protein